MSFESFLENITIFNTIDNVLVCEASFTGLRATVIQKKGDSLTIGQEVSSKQFALDDAVTEVVEQIRKKGWKGEHAILVSPAVCLTVMELNVPPTSKLPVSQLAETVQWEFEPAYNQHQRVMMIGQLLQAQGLLNATEVHDIATQQAALSNTKGNATAYKMFGELAKDMVGLKQADLANCLARQKWFQSEDDGVKCGWHALKAHPMANDGLYRWIVSGISLSVLREWQAVLSKHGFKLEACYPLAGGGQVEKVNDKKSPLNQSKKTTCVIELHQGVLAGVVINNSEPSQIQTVPVIEHQLLEQVNELYHALDVQGQLPLRLIDTVSDQPEQTKQIADDLGHILGRKVEADFKRADKVSMAMRNAAMHFLDVKQTGYVEAVSAHEPKPPVMQRFEVRAILTVMALIAAILLSEVLLFGSAFYFKYRTALISDDVATIRSTIKRVQEEVKKVDTLKSEIKQIKAKEKHADTLITLVSDELPQRNQSLDKLFSALQKTVTDDVVIEQVTEDTILGFKLDAWSLTEQAAQEFVKYFQIAIHEDGYKVKDMTVTEETGRLGLIGYALTFTITQLDDDEWQLRKRVGNRQLPPNALESLRKSR